MLTKTTFAEGTRWPLLYLRLATSLVHHFLGHDRKRFIVSRLLLPIEERYDAYFAFDPHTPYRFQDLKTNTAIHLSARFPFVSPAGTLYGLRDYSKTENATGSQTSPSDVPEVLWGRLVDGGYFDGTGLATAFQIIESVRGAVRDCPKRQIASCPLQPVISLRYISNDPKSDDVLDNPGINGPPPRRPTSLNHVPAMAEVRAVPDAHFAATTAADVGTQRLRAKQEVDDGLFQVTSLAHLAQQRNQQNNNIKWCKYFRAWRPALGWWLSRQSLDEMNQLIDDIHPNDRVDEKNASPLQIAEARKTTLGKNCVAAE